MSTIKTEKAEPHTPLDIVKGLVRVGKVRATNSAFDGALDLEYEDPLFPKMTAVLLALESDDFYKSMVANADVSKPENEWRWHEVYKPLYDGVILYVKFIVTDGVLLVSFKEA